METQTGGEGETIQAKPDIQNTPEQFVADLPPQPEVQPQQEVAPTVEPTSPTLPTEAIEQPVAVQAQPVDLSFDEFSQPKPIVDFSGKEPSLIPNSTNFDYSQFVVPSVDELDIDQPVFESDEPIINIDETIQPIAPVSQIDLEANDNEFVIDFDQDPLPEDNEELKQPEIDVNNAFGDLNESVLSNYTQSNPFKVGTVKDYVPSTTTSKNFVNGFAKAVNIDLKEVDEIIQKNYSANYDDYDEISETQQKIARLESVNNIFESAIKNNDVEQVVKNPELMDELSTSLSQITGTLNDQKNAEYLRSHPGVLGQLQQNYATNLNEEKATLTYLQTVKPAIEGASTTISETVKGKTYNDPIKAYKSKLDKDARVFKKTYAKQEYNHTYKHAGADELIKFIMDGGMEYHVKQKLDNPEYKFTPSGVLNYMIQQKGINLSPEASEALSSIASRKFDLIVDEYYQEKGRKDYMSISGTTIEAKQIRRESEKQIIEARKKVSNDVFTKYSAQVKSWEDKNNALLESRIKEVVSVGDERYKTAIGQVISANPEVQNTVNDYTQKIQSAQSKEEQDMLVDQFTEYLQSVPVIRSLADQRDKYIKANTTQLQGQYNESRSAFMEGIYNESKQEYADKIKAETFKVYKSGLNSDLNLYVKADNVVNSKEFKSADFWTKRKMIQDSWLSQQKEIRTYLLGKTEYFPQKGEEAKPWTEWTGRREKSSELQAKHKQELAQRTGRQAAERYYFYATDDLLQPTNGKMNPFLLKSIAKDELDKLNFLTENEYVVGQSTALQTGGNTFKTAKEGSEINAKRHSYQNMDFNMEDLVQAKENWQAVLNHPESDTSWWKDLSDGLYEGVSTPFVGTIVDLMKSSNVYDAAQNYQAGTAGLSEISLIQSNAAYEQLKQLKPRSMAYDVGSGIGGSLTFVAELFLTGGIGTVAKTGTKKFVGELIEKAVKSEADTAVASMVKAALSNPAVSNRLENISGLVAQSLAQTTANPARIMETTVERMTPQMVLAYSGVYDPITVDIDNNSAEGGLEAFAKSFGINWAEIFAEYAGAGISKTLGSVKNKALQEFGSSDFFKQTVIGNYARRMGFQSSDEMAEYVVKNKIGWDDIFTETVVEELLLGKNLNALITGDEDLFDYSGKEVMTTLLTVGPMHLAMNGRKITKTIINKGDSATSITTTNEKGETSITQLSKDNWNQFNTLISQKDVSFKKIATWMSSKNLNEDQQTALMDVFLKSYPNMKNDVDLNDALSDIKEESGEDIGDLIVPDAEIKVFEDKTPDPIQETEIENVEQTEGGATDLPFDISQDTESSTPSEKQTNTTTIESELNEPASEVETEEVNEPDVQKQTIDFLDKQFQMEMEEVPLIKNKNVEENNQGLPSTEQGGEAIVEEGFAKEESVETPTSSGMVQEPQVTEQEVEKVASEMSIDETTEKVIIPPTSTVKKPRFMEKENGEWKMRVGDTLESVSPEIQDMAQTFYESEKTYQEMRRSEKENDVRKSDSTRKNIEDLFDSMKIKGDSLKSSLIPPPIWNGFVDATKRFVLAGYDLSTAITKARREVLSPEVKAGNIDKKNVDKALSKMRDDYRKNVEKATYQKMEAGKRLAKALPEARTESDTTPTAEPEGFKANRKSIQKMIKNFDEGSKAKSDELKSIKEAIISYAKENVSPADLKKAEFNKLLKAIEKANSKAELKDSMNKVDFISSAQTERVKSGLIKDINKMVESNHMRGKKPKQKGIGAGAYYELKDFIENYLPDNLEDLSIEELQEVADELDAIISNGKADVRVREKLQTMKNRQTNGDIVSEMKNLKKVDLKSMDDVFDWIANGGTVLINGKLATTENAAQEVEKAEGFKSAQGIEQILSKTSKMDVSKLRQFFMPRGAAQFIGTQLQSFFFGEKSKAIFEQLPKMISEAEENLSKEEGNYLGKIADKANEIFGAKTVAGKVASKVRLFAGLGDKIFDRMSQRPTGIAFDKKLKEGSDDSFTNGQLANIYAHIVAGDEAIVERSGVSAQAVKDYFNKPENKDLKDFVEWIVKDYLVEMKEEVTGPLYELTREAVLPEGLYYPRKVDFNSVNSSFTQENITSSNGFSVTTVMSDHLKDIVSEKSTLNLDANILDVMDKYTKSMLNTKYFLPIAKYYDRLFASDMMRFYQNILPKGFLKNTQLNLSAAITGENPFSGKLAEPIVKVFSTLIAPIAAAVQIGGKVASIPKQGIALFNYYTAGIKYGISPLSVIKATAPLNYDELDVWQDFFSRPNSHFRLRYSKAKWDRSINDLHMYIDRYNSSSGQLKERSAMFASNAIKKTMALKLIFTTAGDAISVGIGGSHFLLASYRKFRSEGMSHQEAKEKAYNLTADVTKLTQQSSSKVATGLDQRGAASKLFFAYRSGQYAIFNKMMSAFKTLSDSSTYSAKEKQQAAADLVYNSLQLLVYSVIAGKIANAWSDADDDEKKVMMWSTGLDATQSLIQGMGAYGGLADWAINASRGKGKFNAVPALEFTTDFLTATYERFFDWDSLTDEQKDRVIKQLGIGNEINTYEDFAKWAQGDKSFADFMTQYDPEKFDMLDYAEKDRLVKLFTDGVMGLEKNKKTSSSSSLDEFDSEDFSDDSFEEIPNE